MKKESQGERLKAILSHLKLTQSAFAERVGSSQQLINLFARSKREVIGGKVLYKIKEAFPSINLDWLVTGEG